MRKVLLALGLVTTALVVGLAVVPAGATGDAHSWYVCKYVGPPASPNETLQGGDNPIFVDEHSIDTYPNVAVGDEFADGQDQSVVIAGPYAPPGLDVEPVCPTTPVTSTTAPPPPPPTTTAPPPPPPTSTTQPPPPPPTSTTVVVPPTTVTPVPPCKGSVALGPWYGDPRVNITLTGAGHFVVSGGVQRFTNTRTFDVTLGCGQVQKIGRYKIKNGHYLTITLDGVRVVYETPPAV